MTVLTRTPQNTNLLQPTKFLLTFSRLPNVQYFCQSVNLPGVSVGQSILNFPSVDVYTPGNKITYNNLNVSFTVDEELKTWKEMYNWFRSFASPDGTEERNRLSALQNQGKISQKPWYSDATLTILSSLNNPILRVEFVNIFPVSLSDLQFDTKMSADDIITADAMFVYDQLKFVDI
jgi:hypothetical protein